jgi:uncharacterized protein (DUF58 family)
LKRVPGDFKTFSRSKIQLFSSIKQKNIFPGAWDSVYTGEGIEFATVKPFEPEDDLRELDLHTLVQSGEEEIIQRVVERQMDVFVWADFSGSMQTFEQMFFPRKPEIRDLATGLLLFSASNSYSPAGFCAFNREMKQFFPARYGERYCWEILNWVIDEGYRGSVAPADFQGAVTFLIERASPKSLVFFISDFKDEVFEGDFRPLLKPLVEGFDFVPVVIRDPLEKSASLTRSVTLVLRDSEGNRSDEIHLTSETLREIQEVSARSLMELEQTFRSAGIEHVVLDSSSAEDCYKVLAGFFEARRRVKE